MQTDVCGAGTRARRAGNHAGACLLGVGILGANSHLGDRIETLLHRGRAFSPRASLARIAVTALALFAFTLAASLAPRWVVFAQQQPRPKFDVASIKPNPGGQQGVDFEPMTGGRLHVRNNPVTNLISNAYGIGGLRQIGAPGWASSDRFDIEARAEGNPTEAEIKLMLQSLLEDRFKLQVHRETRDLPAFNLVAVKGGVKVKLLQEGSCAVVDPFNPTPASPAGTPGQPHCGNNLISANGPRTDWTAVKIDMAGVAGALTAITRRRVIDKTGFKGNFAFHLQWTNDPAISDAAGDDTGPSFFTILQDELGLKLEPTKTAAEVLVIDHLEKPDAN